jgi:hypothetical protein
METLLKPKVSGATVWEKCGGDSACAGAWRIAAGFKLAMVFRAMRQGLKLAMAF